MPHLQTLVKRHEDDPFVLIGINYGDDEKAYRKGLKDFKVSWLSAFAGKSGNSKIVEMFNVQGFPTYYLIDAEGKIVGSDLSGHAYDKKIAELVAQAKKSL